MPAAGLRIVILLGWVILLAAAALYLWPSLPALQSDLGRLHDLLQHGAGWRQRNPALAILSFLGGFAVAGSLPLPVVVALTLTGGAFFGFWLGLGLSLLGTVLAATISFLVARHLLSGWVRKSLSTRIERLDARVEQDGALALLSLRLTPALPFFVVNIMSGLSIMSVQRFAWITALGVLPNKIILTAAGTELAEVQRVSDIFGPRVVALIAALAVLPWAMRWLRLRMARAR
ncbi:TVP38/TMEM64 family protein [Paracoccus indicus]|uniref:TVP38/TMEM64 family protein n=1 Tax=Paracoccus indicus TaxID=2079229 RepID=UPI000D3A6E01|nr:VTT domain-containing protein [Paracoccus indicus]